MSEHEPNEQGSCSKCGSPSHTGGHTPGCPANVLTDEEKRQLVIRQIKSENKIEDSRNESQDQWEMRADARNDYRSLWKKIFGMDKTEAMDIAVEEALKMDEAIEDLLKEGKAKDIEEAIEIVDQQREFQPKKKDKIEKEEYFRPDILQFGNALEENDFNKAVMLIHKVESIKGADGEVQKALREIISPLIDKKIAELVKNKDGESFVEAFINLSRLKDINVKDLGLSEEEFRSPEILNAAKGYLVNELKTYGVDHFVHNRDKMVEAGIATEEEVESWPEIIELKKKAK